MKWFCRGIFQVMWTLHHVLHFLHVTLPIFWNWFTRSLTNLEYLTLGNLSRYCLWISRDELSYKNTCCAIEYLWAILSTWKFIYSCLSFNMDIDWIFAQTDPWPCLKLLTCCYQYCHFTVWRSMTHSVWIKIVYRRLVGCIILIK